jgi:VanZ family protein
VALLAFLSLVPDDLEVRTGAPGQFEHLAAYIGTAVLFALSYPRKRVLITVGLFAYAGLLEALQSFSPGRSPSMLDALASGSGAIFGVLVIALFARR